MKSALFAVCLTFAFASVPQTAIAKEAVIVAVGAPHEGSVLYGPADMLCDMHMCRMFGLPAAAGLPKNGVVEFGLPQPYGQARIDIKRCLDLCRASVVGFPSERTSARTTPNPTIFITPVELRLE